jgi:N-formylmaleamate deformylase
MSRSAMAWRSGLHRANGVDLHYLRTGGDKPPLVLLHGLAADGACWTPLARALESDHDVVMPDARGHGDSSAPLHGYRYEDHAADVVGLIRGLELSAPILLGHSMGGLTAAVAASHARETIRGLILADPTFLSPQRQREVHESDVAEQHRRLLGRDRAHILADLQARHPRRSPEILELLASARLKTRVSAFEVLTPPNPDYRRLVSAIDVPVLLILADGGVVSADTSEELRTRNPRLEIEMIEDAGHGLHFDQPARFEGVVRGFLRSVLNGRGPLR